MISTDCLVSHEKHLGLEQWIYRFPNNYGASVQRLLSLYSPGRGKFELAVLHWCINTSNGKYKGFITYKTSITDKIIEGLTSKDIDTLLNQIKTLK